VQHVGGPRAGAGIEPFECGIAAILADGRTHRLLASATLRKARETATAKAQPACTAQVLRALTLYPERP
jgi:hypothetical protein